MPTRTDKTYRTEDSRAMKAAISSKINDPSRSTSQTQALTLLDAQLSPESQLVGRVGAPSPTLRSGLLCFGADLFHDVLVQPSATATALQSYDSRAANATKPSRWSARSPCTYSTPPWRRRVLRIETYVAHAARHTHSHRPLRVSRVEAYVARTAGHAYVHRQRSVLYVGAHVAHAARHAHSRWRRRVLRIETYPNLETNASAFVSSPVSASPDPGESSKKFYSNYI